MGNITNINLTKNVITIVNTAAKATKLTPAGFLAGLAMDVGVSLASSFIYDFATKQDEEPKTLAEFKSVADKLKKSCTDLEKILAQQTSKLNPLQKIVTDIQNIDKDTKKSEVEKQKDREERLNQGIKDGLIKVPLTASYDVKASYLNNAVVTLSGPAGANQRKLSETSKQAEGASFDFQLKNSVLMIPDIKNKLIPDLKRKMEDVLNAVNAKLKGQSGVASNGNSTNKDNSLIADSINNVASVFNGMTDSLNNVATAVQNLADSNIKPETNEAESETTEENFSFSEAVNEAFKDVTTKFEALTDAITKYFENALNEDATTKTGSTASSGNDNNNTQTGNAATGAGNGTGTTGSTKDVWSNLKERAKQPMENMLNNIFNDALAGKMKNFGDYFKSFADSILQSLTSQITSQLSKMLAENILNSFSWFGRAEGGPVNGGSTYIVGERGPEVFVPNTSGNIIPNHKLGGLADSDATAPSVTVNVINNSGQQVSAKQESHFDGQRYVVDVWLDALARNVGGVRDVIYAGR